MIKKILPSIFKIGLLGMFLLGFTFGINAQTVEINSTVGAYSGNAVVGQNNYHAQENIYLDAEIGATNFIGATNAISKIAYSVNAITAITFPLTVDSIYIYMKNVASATKTFTAGAYSLAGYTLVYYGPVDFNAIGWNEITLTTPFARTSGTNLQILQLRKDNVAGSGLVMDCSTGNSTNTSANSARRYNGATAAIAGSTSLTATNFRPAIQLINPIANDVSINDVIGGPENISCNNLPTSYAVTIKNLGTSSIPVGAVTLSLTLSGANTYNNSINNNTVLAPSATEVINFTNIPISVNGSTSVVALATMASDGYKANDTAKWTITSSTPITAFPAKESAETNPLSVFPWIKTVAGTRQLWRLGAGINNADLSDSIAPQDGNLNYIFDNYSGANSAGTIGRLYSNCITLPSGLTPASYHMNFWLSHDTSFSTSLDSMIVVVSTDKGVTWTRLAGYQRYDASYTTAGWGEDSVSLAAYAGQTIQLGFEGQSDYGNVMCLDNITVWANGPLPIKLNLFSGSREGTKNVLAWETANEQNNKGFELQRGLDGKEFKAIAFVNSKASNGNSSAALNYSYTDTKPANANNYYRLRQVDINGKESFSNVVVIKATQNTKAEITTVFPNPAKEKINIILNTVNAEKVTVKVTDLAGRVVSVKNIETIAGDNNIQFNTVNFATGTYMIKVTTANNVEIATQKFVKM